MWTCENCQAIVDADFEICWNCQHPRPESSTLDTAEAAAAPATGLRPAPASPSVESKYKVIPFGAHLDLGNPASNPATQLETAITAQARDGWEFVSLQDIAFEELTPGSSGCFGFGSTPSTSTTKRIYLIVLRR